MSTVQKARDQVLSKRHIEGLIAHGHQIVVYSGQVLQLDAWMDKHPGGSLALQHMVGNDATSEIMA
jgi:delta8-fatty-acid desaturase